VTGEVPPALGQGDILDERDYELILLSVMRKHPEGLSKEEIGRRCDAVTKQVAGWKLDGALYRLFREEKVLVDMGEDGDVWLSHTKGPTK
jgi:hypothetical protein